MQNTGAEKCFHINNFIDEPCLSHLGAGEEEAHSLHADLQETALAWLDVLDWELSPELHARGDAPHAPGRRPLHGGLDAVVEVPALGCVIFV